jgi:hypothetical protein
VRAFLALAAISGITARAVALHTDVHIVAEYYAPELGRWVFVDPYFRAMAVDSSGTYLSLLDVQILILSHRSPVFRLLGNRSPETSRIFAKIYDNAALFQSLRLVNGNNVVEVDEVARRTSWMPKGVTQLIDYVIGIRPGYIQYARNASRISVLAANCLHWAALGCFGVFVVTLVGFPLWFLFQRGSSLA